VRFRPPGAFDAGGASSSRRALASGGAKAERGRDTTSQSGLRRKRQSASFSGPDLESSGSNAEDFTKHGQLLITYANGDCQALPVKGTVLHPRLEIKPAAELLDFSRVHVHSPKPVEVTLSNPTQVDATWSAMLPTAGRPKFPGAPEELAGASTSEARFGPFIVRPAFGLLPGRGLHLPRTLKVTITFAPTEASDYAQGIRFAVQNGPSLPLMLKGSGSFDETEEFQAAHKHKM
jgi:hypothetical protein